MTILRCDKCGGKYGGRYTHSCGSWNPFRPDHSPVNERFVSCQICHGHGAHTCLRCDGTGLIQLDEGAYIGPAIDASREKMNNAHGGAHPQRPRKARR